MKDAIHRFKFNENPQNGKKLGQLVGRLFFDGAEGFLGSLDSDCLRQGHIDYIVPVPLHFSKKLKRGFNQSEILAKEISDMSHIEYYPKLLAKARKTQAQSNLHRDERQNNLIGAFTVINKTAVLNKNILIIDDIYTTGSTINEVSKTLFEAGAGEIYSLTLAITSIINDKEENLV